MVIMNRHPFHDPISGTEMVLEGDVCADKQRPSIPCPHAKHDPSRQWCVCCGSQDHFDYCVSDEVWAAIVPEPLSTNHVCLRCFDALLTAGSRTARRRPDAGATSDVLGRAGDPDLARLGNPAEHVSLSRLGVTGTPHYGFSFGSPFSGIGGLDRGLEEAEWTCAWQIEINPFCRAVLEHHWPDVPRFADVKDVDPRDLAPVDLIAGGFPCQDISDAHTNGQRQALSGPLSGLWVEFRRLVAHLRPVWVLVENVAAWRRWVPSVRGDLHQLGYASLPLQLSAGSFGAPHRRPRVFLVAHANGQGEPLRAIHAEVARLSPLPRGGGDWGLTTPRNLRVDDGVPARMDRLHALGNAVVPQVGRYLGRLIMEAA